MKFSEFVYELNSVIPEDMQEQWDNCGIQVKTSDDEIERVLVSLEITEDVIEEAIEKDVQLIITHHPLIFGGIKSVNIDSATGKYIASLINHGINVYSCHTNFDKIGGGNNDMLCDILEMDEVGTLYDEDFTRCGYCQKQSVRQIAEKLAAGTGSSSDEFRIAGNPDRIVESIALCSGAGSEYISLAAECGFELYITGDVKYHEARNAEESGISVIDAGHYGTERIFPKAFISMMEENEFNVDMDFIEARCCNNPFNLLK